MNKTILITGGLGYIGSHMSVQLLEEGYDVVIIDNLSNSERFILDRIEEISGKKPYFYEIDLCDLDTTKEVFEKHTIDGIIHFAALKAVGESVEKPLFYYQNNLTGLLNILEIIKEKKVPFVFSSSCTVYGQVPFEDLPISENTPLQKALSPYGATKAMAEQILEDFSKSFDSKVIALRYFNPIGAHPTAKIGELPKGVPNNLIPFITQTGIGKRKELKVFGDDYPTKDGTAIRDYIYVMDLTDAHSKALTYMLNNKQTENFEVFNLGTGKGSSVMEVIQSFEKVSHKKLNYQITERRAGDITAAYADNSKSEKALGWKPETTLDKAVETAWKWELSLKTN